LGYFTWAAAEGEGTPATPDSVEGALAAAIGADTARYTELWDGLTINQRRLLEAIGSAAPTDEALSEDFRRRHRLGAYATVERALDSLVERGLVEREGRARSQCPTYFCANGCGVAVSRNGSVTLSDRWRAPCACGRAERTPEPGLEGKL